MGGRSVGDGVEGLLEVRSWAYDTKGRSAKAFTGGHVPSAFQADRQGWHEQWHTRLVLDTHSSKKKKIPASSHTLKDTHNSIFHPICA